MAQNSLSDDIHLLVTRICLGFWYWCKCRIYDSNWKGNKKRDIHISFYFVLISNREHWTIWELSAYDMQKIILHVMKVNPC